MTDVVISGTGLWHPQTAISNEELVRAYNIYADRYNAEHAAEIEEGAIKRVEHSSSEFIEKASGIKQRYAFYAEGICDPDRLMPLAPKRSWDELSESAEMGVSAAREAIAQAGIHAGDIDMIICGMSTSQRPWPAIGVEIQKALGCKGFAFDMTIACSTSTFALSLAADAIVSGTAKRVLIVSPELNTTQVDYKERDSHFIFGDVSTAMVVERADLAVSPKRFKILDKKLYTEFSNNIRSDFSFVRRCQPNLSLESFFEPEMFFTQQGRKVFKELLPIVSDLVETQLEDAGISITDIKRMWLHQANINMNLFAAKKILGRDPEPGEAPMVLDEFANTAASGSIIAFHRHSSDLAPGDKGVICSFGAGYSVGSVIVERV